MVKLLKFGVVVSNLKTLADEIGRLFQLEARRLSQEGTILKIVLIVGGGTFAGVAQFMSSPEKGGVPWNQILGIGGVMAMALGGLYSTFRERQTPGALDEARKALEVAREFQARELDQKLALEELEDKQRRLSHIYQAMQIMREAIEQTLLLPPTSERQVADTVLDLASTSIRSAIDFQMDETWTVSIYEAVQGSGGIELECIAADRFDRRAANITRRWAIGVGHTGAAYARGSEIVVPDLADAALGTLDQLPAGYSHPTDQGRYRSIAAVPIRLGPNGPPWGVVVASSDRPRRFTLNLDEPGSLGAETTRAVAGMIGLAVEAYRSRPMPSQSALATPPNP